uniref:Uncharacterized protein n=1 Tax=Timema cristinae TaxID=61476 RepID=A0A7R9D3D3_TIMCR|nr:unnamed protein product [Timema cristinae]
MSCGVMPYRATSSFAFAGTSAFDSDSILSSEKTMLEANAQEDETILLKQLPVKHGTNTWLVAFVSMVTNATRRLHRSSPQLFGQIYTCWSHDCQCIYQRHERANATIRIQPGTAPFLCREQAMNVRSEEQVNVTNSTSQSDKEEEWVDPVIVYDDHFVGNKEEEYFMDAIIDQKSTSKPDKEEELNYIDFLFDEGYNMQSKAEELMDSSENQQDDFNETQDDFNETHDDFETLFKRELSNCTTTTVGEVLIMILSLALKHSLTWVAVLDIISMINIIFNFDIIPKTKYFIKKIFSSGNSVLYHIYCPKCKALIGKKETLKNEELCVCGHII